MKTQFFTGAGDKGNSALGGEKLSKDDIFFYALGSLDELNSWLGVCRAASGATQSAEEDLKRIQETLFIAQAELYSAKAGKAGKRVSAGHVKFLENLIKDIDGKMPKLEKFVIPGGSELSARLDYARTLARTAERNVVRLSKEAKVSLELLRFFNRLSSALFALARYANHEFNIKEENPSYGKV